MSNTRKKLTVTLLMLMFVSFIPVIAQETENFLPINVETYLINDFTDYKKYGLDHIKDLPEYNTESLTDFHMPIVYRIPSSAKMDIERFLKQGIFLNQDKNFNERILDCGYNVYGNLKPDEYFMVDYWLKIKASDKPFSIDFVPIIELDKTKYELKQYAWWNSSWDKMKTITINHNYIDSGLSDYPILIHINDTSVLDVCQDSGQDIRFINSTNTTEYNYEIESWNTTDAFIWVNVTTISSSINTVFNMYYNNSGANDGQNIINTWSGIYNMVHHLIGTPYTALDDSTSNNNDVTGVGSIPIYNSAGKISSGIGLDGLDDYVTVSDSSTLEQNDFTMGCWFKADSFSTLNSILAKYDKTSDSTKQYYIIAYDWDSDSNYEMRFELWKDSGNYIAGDTTYEINIDTWYYIVFSFDSTTGSGILYIDGVSRATDTNALVNSVQNDDEPFTIGSRHGGTERYFDGIIDEVFYIDECMNVSCIKTNFHSQNQTTGFITFGSELEDTVCPAITYSGIVPTHGSTVSYLTSNLNVTINISNGANFNYTIECSNGNTTSANGVGNGTYNLSVCCLESETLYYWYVNSSVNATCGWTNTTYNFTTGVCGCQCIDELTLIYNKLDEIKNILEGDEIIEMETTQFVITVLLALFCIFLWIGYTIPAMEGTKKSLHYMPFSGGLFVIFGGFAFISFAVLLTYNYDIGIVGGFLTTIGIILLFYGILKAFYYELD